MNVSSSDFEARKIVSRISLMNNFYVIELTNYIKIRNQLLIQF